ncbi:MAG: hypothetical protein ACD_12C00312G0020 [uncultured bacterium]|nr:MAG: hypothetical protein ACD_12C00312G0020 [uncultured bacterium]
MIDIIFLASKIILTLFFIGYGFTAIIIPEKLRRDAFWLSPWLGIIFSVVFGVALTMARIPINQGKYAIFFFSFLFFVYSIIKKKSLSIFSKKNLIISIFVLISLFFNLYPLIANAGFPTTISLGNLDPLAYTNVGEYLIDHSLIDDKTELANPYKPHLKSVGDLLFYGFRWGSPLFLGFVSDTLGVRAYQVYYILIAIFFILTFPLVYITSKNFLKKENRYLLLIIFLTFAMNSTLLYMLYNGFFAQFMFSGIFALILIFLQSYFSENKNLTNFFNLHDFLIAISISSVSSIYSEGLIFICFPLIIYFLLKILSKERWHIFWSLTKILFLAILINPVTFGLAIKWSYGIFFLAANTTFIGWEKIRFSTPLEMTGFYNTVYYKNLPPWLDIVLAIPVGVILLQGLKMIKERTLIISYLVLFGLFYLLYLIIFRNYYTHLKTVSYMIFLYSIVFSTGITGFLDIFKNRIISFILVAVMIFLSIRSAHRSMSQLYYHQQAVNKKIVSLRELNSNKSISGPFLTADLFLGEYDLWTRFWQEYMLYDKAVVSRSNFSDFLNINDMLVLSEKSRLTFDHKTIKYKKIVWDNQYYQLGEIEPMKISK